MELNVDGYISHSLCLSKDESEAERIGQIVE